MASDPVLDRPWKRQVSRNSKYFCADDMPADGSDLTVRIKRITAGTLAGFSGGKKMPDKDTLFLHFDVIAKPLGINRGIGDTIQLITGSKMPRAWLGQLITLYVTEATTSSGKTDAVRVRPDKPSADDLAASTRKYKAPPFDLETARGEFRAAGSLEELRAVKANMRKVPDEHVQAVRDAYAAREAELTKQAAP